MKDLTLAQIKGDNHEKLYNIKIVISNTKKKVIVDIPLQVKSNKKGRNDLDQVRIKVHL